VPAAYYAIDPRCRVPAAGCAIEYTVPGAGRVVRDRAHGADEVSMSVTPSASRLSRKASRAAKSFVFAGLGRAVHFGLDRFGIQAVQGP